MSKKLNGKAKAKARKLKKASMNTINRRKKADMPSFIVRLNIDENFNIDYDNTGLVEKQISFVDTCINQLKESSAGEIEDPTNAFGYVFWGKADDYVGQISEPKTGADLDAHWTELKDMFFAQYWETTNQKVELSETYCNAVTSNTNYKPIGATLGSVKQHQYSNFAISVAYTKQFAKMSKVGGKTFGDLAPPEVDPNSKCYSPNYVEKVKQALSNFGIEIEANWKPGMMETKLIAA
jgi:hypothetical protein